MVCPVLAAVAVLRGWSRTWRLVAVALLVASMPYVLTTQATQGPLAAAAGLAVVGAAWLLARRRAGGLELAASGPARLIPAVAALVGVVVLAGVAIRLAPDALSSVGERRQFWQASLAIFADYPALGTGLDTFRDTSPSTGRRRTRWSAASRPRTPRTTCRLPCWQPAGCRWR